MEVCKCNIHKIPHVGVVKPPIYIYVRYLYKYKAAATKRNPHSLNTFAHYLYKLLNFFFKS